MRPPETKDLAYYVRAFSRLRANPRGKGVSPHKPVLLLALLEFFETGEIKENRLEFSPGLLDRFSAIFSAARNEGDRCNATLPFYHLTGDRFWRLKAKPGKAEVLAAIHRIKAQSQMSELVECAYLDNELFALLQQPAARTILRETLLDRWFRGPASQTIQSVLTEERQTGLYQNFIRSRVEESTLKEAPPMVEDKVRSKAFCRPVREACDLRWAACGWRLVFPDGRPLVESVHLVPFSETFDDDPRNGMALSPTYHELLDAFVIAPGPDLKWHVSPLIDPRIPDNRELCTLHGRRILLPRDKRYFPRKDELDYCLQRLAK